ncbi:M20/M25/M40 family metallo-hydrolase [uncultured Limosilactobacillus sp.]|uniref:M20/M25/M40 family metallo-hydrolase n=1 Tax=uncultured Limosilactobacillus sp. TaxID=2837629 RepID=UPI0025F1CDD5|nr:M20/M25/M40 family metallo-hydrolase [uncultured Limosilactobacillus sp.]
MKQIQQYCQSHLLSMLELAKQLVNVDSPATSREGGERVAAILKAKMAQLGMTTRQIDRGKPGMVLVGELSGPADMAPVILLGHLDTVFPVGTAKQRPFQQKGDQLSGPGIFDMKGGLVSGLFAIQALVELGLRHCPIKLIIVSDEEKLHLGSRASEIIEKECDGGAYGLNLEGSANDFARVVTSNRGGMIVEAVVQGQAAHSGAEPTKGRSAIEELAHQIIQFSSLTNLDAGIHVNCGMIQGGTSENIIPDQAMTRIGIRFRTNQQGEQLLQQLQAIAAHPTILGTRTTIKILTRIKSMEETVAVKRLFQRLNQVSHQIGYGSLHAVEGGGASDAGIMVAQGVPTIDGLGIVGSGAHSTGERASANSLLKRAILLASFIAQQDSLE